MVWYNIIIMWRKRQDDVKLITKKNTSKEKFKRNGVYGNKHIRALEFIKNNKKDKK